MKKAFLRFSVLGMIVCVICFTVAANWNAWPEIDVSHLPDYRHLLEAVIEVPKVTGPMVMDGRPLEEDWQKAAVIRVLAEEAPSWQKFGTHCFSANNIKPVDNNDFSYDIFLLHDEKNLYVFAKVWDDVLVVNNYKDPHEVDALEMFFDPDHNGLTALRGYYSPVDYRTGIDEAYSTTHHTTVVRGRWEKGYTLEFNIFMDDIRAGLAPLDGKRMGFDVQGIDVDDKSPMMRDFFPMLRDKCFLAWSGGENLDWKTGAYYGEIVFQP